MKMLHDYLSQHHATESAPVTLGNVAHWLDEAGNVCRSAPAPRIDRAALSAQLIHETGGVWAPVFDGHGHRFFVQHPDWLALSEESAREIGIGGQLVEGVLLGFRYVEARFFPLGVSFTPGRLGPFTVCVIAPEPFGNSEQLPGGAT